MLWIDNRSQSAICWGIRSLVSTQEKTVAAEMIRRIEDVDVTVSHAAFLKFSQFSSL